MPNLYVNPALNAPLGPDGLPIQVDPNFVQQDYEVRCDYENTLLYCIAAD